MPPVLKPRVESTFISVTHEAATPPGIEVTAKVELTEVRGKKLIFSVEAYDDAELVSKGSHERIIINKREFEERTWAKRS